MSREMPKPPSLEEKKEGEIYNFEDRPNQEALVEQRKKHIKLAIDNFFKSLKPIQVAETSMEFNPMSSANIIGDKEPLDAIAEIVMTELKNRQGINEQSEDKAIEEFERAYPTQLIKQEIFQDHRVNGRKDDKGRMHIQI